MADIIQFPARKARSGGVFCQPLSLHFPTLHRVTSTLTAEDIVAIGLADDPEIEPGTWTHYDLEVPTDTVGTVFSEVVTHVRPEDQAESLVIRHHPNLAHAYGYIDGCSDLHLSKDDDEEMGRMLFQTDEGVFTLTSTPTRGSWPGPLVFYMATIPSNNIAGWECWAHIVGPDGEVLDGRLFGF